MKPIFFLLFSFSFLIIGSSCMSSIKTVNENEAQLIKKIKVGSLYEHYSGKRYKVLMLTRSSEDTSLQVVYQGVYTDKEFGENPVWVRPLSMFVESVVMQEKTVPRFKEIEGL
jgi:hypothetical protein